MVKGALSVTMRPLAACESTSCPFFQICIMPVVSMIPARLVQDPGETSPESVVM